MHPLLAKLAVLLATLAPPPNAPEDIDPPKEKQHFCCSATWIDEHERANGEGCFAIGKEQINQCGELLYCSGTYTKSGGVTTCL